MNRGNSTAGLAIVLAAAGLALAQTDTQSTRGKVERIKVHGKSLEGNLEGDSPDRDVSIYLPPSYATAANRRYPVIYLLHGYTDRDDLWFEKPHFINVPAVTDKALAGGSTREMIIVMPNAYTAYQGSMYSSSPTTGDWESFVARDLVAYVDAHYRTIPEAVSRGLAGHSMGGYGTVRIGMKNPEVFSSLYILSPCCMSANISPKPSAKAAAITSPADLAQADFGTKAQLASAAAWSPDPKNPPLFLDLPYNGDELQPEVVAKWAANAPLAMIDQYVANLRKMHAIAMDAGDKDEPIATTVRTLDRILTSYDISHTFEIYPGNHVSGIADRMERKALPFFSKNLSFGQGTH